ncbi:hypothetical protein [Actinokineospora globicatena]|uniref:DUF5666 domain-containing protein n=1 Tax=Actinokineospora globicatena TaxID=103729 RepID=A0A9W6QFH8_9PSEU|nr:hypothetical protein [Actinokineospora globicatena]GLW89498.1 hypothetical protein Aglo03_03140 [Actinokineospora globicatena]
MNTESPTPDQSTWGAPASTDTDPTGTRRWSPKKAALAMVVAVGIAGAGGYAAYAATGSDTSQTTDQGPGGTGPGGGGMGGLTDALHGEFQVSDGSGGTTTQVLQTGEVTAISATELTAVSEDGYTKTYTIDADTVLGATTTSGSTTNGTATSDSATSDSAAGDIATGDTVTVVATVSGDTATATSVREQGTGGDQPPAQPTAGN